MKRIILIGPGHPSGNPRLVRDADALTERGYDVQVLGVRFRPDVVQFDEELLRGRPWRYEFVDYLDTSSNRARWHFARMRRRFCGSISKLLAWDCFDRRACLYGASELTRLALAGRADFYIAHQHSTLPIAGLAAHSLGCPYAFDAEDLLVDGTDEPGALFQRYEKSYLRKCAYISTMSDAAGQRLQQTNGLTQQPIILHNTPRLQEREGLVEPMRRPIPDMPSIYWFGQTLGAHSCAEQVVRALPLLIRPVCLTLRGNRSAPYVSHLQQLAEQLKVGHLLKIVGLASPGDMVRLAGQHDILLGSQPGQDLFHQMAIGNKVFTGMMAGLALALTDTIAHRRLLEKIPLCGFLFPDGNPEAFAEGVNALLSRDDLLRDYQQRSWHFAENSFNWEKESVGLLNAVDNILAAV